MFRLGRLERMDLSRDNPAVDYYLRLEVLSDRGLSAGLVQSLWQSGDRSLLARCEALTDEQIAVVAED